MRPIVPWIIVAFLGAYFVFHTIGYRQQQREQERRGSIAWQVEVLADWLELSDTQKEDYLLLRQRIVAKEKDFLDFRKKDIKEFLEANTDLDEDEKIRQLKDRHLARLKQTKEEELDLWSAWLDTLTYEQRRKYINGVFEHRPLDSSWYDRDLFDDLQSQNK
jgi:hypothetical protein